MWWKGQYMTWLDCIKAVFVLVSNHFRKCFSINAGVWLRMENKFSENYFQLTGCFKGFDPKMVWSENFHFKPFLDSRAKREREREREREPSTSPIYEPTDLRTDHAFDFVDFADHVFDFTDLWTHEPIFDPEPSTSLATQSLRATNQSLSLCDFDRPTSLWSLIFFFVVVVVWVVVFWWFSCCVVVGLCGWWWKIAFSECYQTHENIF